MYTIDENNKYWIGEEEPVIGEYECLLQTFVTWEPSQSWIVNTTIWIFVDPPIALTETTIFATCDVGGEYAVNIGQSFV